MQWLSGSGALMAAAVVIGLGSAAQPASAQNWSFDARRIALGGVGTAENAASALVEEQRRYRSVVIPLGLIQLFREVDVFKPENDAFDPVRAMEYAASPLHYTFGREPGGSASTFVADVVNAAFSRDLNRYRGFVPATSLVAEGLASPNWGKTFVVSGSAGNAFHGVYVGAGPYMSVRTSAAVDQSLVDLLGGAENRYIPNAAFGINNTTANQLALAVTGGYRARFSLTGASASAGRDGVYIAANYHYLHGFRYDDFDFTLRFDTDASGLLTVSPATAPLDIVRRTSSKGRGFALDFGASVVSGRWDFGFGASGVANRIDWKALDRERYVLRSLFEGGEFEDSSLPGIDTTFRVELPTSYATDVAYHADRWTAVTEYAHGFQGHNFRGGLEYRIRSVELRGGARYSRDRWHPSAGAGFNLTPRFAVDAAVFGTSANIERRRDTAVAVSLRFQ